METSKIVQEIQYLVAPAVMVSSSALLLLGFQNKFSALANRFRVLNHEKRLLVQKPSKEKTEEIRLGNLIDQIEHLMKRAKLVKDAILFTYLAIVAFVGTSILIFLNANASFDVHRWIVAVFVVGFFSLMLSSVCIILETRLFHKVMLIEKQA